MQYLEVTPARRVTELDIERHGLWAGLFCSVLGLAAGLLVFAGQRPAVFGGVSAGLVAAICAAVSAAVCTVHAFRSMLLAREPWLKRIPAWRRWAAGTGLLLVHAASVALAVLVVALLLQRAFFGLQLDLLSASLAVAAASGISAYLCLVSIARTTSESLSVVLGLFMASGVLVSMLLAEDPWWWRSMFSALGTRQAGAGSAWIFNSTLVISGLVLAALVEFLTRDLARIALRYQSRSRWRKPRPAFVRWCLLLVAAGIIGVGVFPVSLAELLHSSCVRLAAVAMIVLLAATVLVLPGFPLVFHLMSYAAIGAFWAGFELWNSWGYYNLTGFELAAVAVIFSWIAAFIRTTAAMQRDAAARES